MEEPKLNLEREGQIAHTIDIIRKDWQLGDDDRTRLGHAALGAGLKLKKEGEEGENARIFVEALRRIGETKTPTDLVIAVCLVACVKAGVEYRLNKSTP